MRSQVQRLCNKLAATILLVVICNQAAAMPTGEPVTQTAFTFDGYAFIEMAAHLEFSNSTTPEMPLNLTVLDTGSPIFVYGFALEFSEARLQFDISDNIYASGPFTLKAVDLQFGEAVDGVESCRLQDYRITVDIYNSRYFCPKKRAVACRTEKGREITLVVDYLELELSRPAPPRVAKDNFLTRRDEIECRSR